MSEVLANIAKAKTSATLTVRIVKSFEYRTERSLVLHDIDLEKCTVGELKRLVRKVVLCDPAWKLYRGVELDTLKIYTKAHGTKTNNLIINLEHDDWILDNDDKTLEEHSFENETELSFFNLELYNRYKLNPATAWD